MIVHPSSYYVGVKTKRPFVEKGTPFDLDVIGVDLDGKAVPGAKIDVKSVRLDWEYKKGRYHTKEVDPQTCAVVAATDAVPCEFQTTRAARISSPRRSSTPRAAPNQTKMTYWVSGGENAAARDVAQERVQLIPDKKEYTPGNTAEIMVQSPFYPAEGVVTWRRSGIVKTERITMTGPTASLKVPITDAMVPNLVRAGRPRRHGGAHRTTRAIRIRSCRSVRRTRSARINLSVPPKQRTLAVDGHAGGREAVARRRARSSRSRSRMRAGKPVAGCRGRGDRRRRSGARARPATSSRIRSKRSIRQRGTDTRDYYERAT